MSNQNVLVMLVSLIGCLAATGAQAEVKSLRGGAQLDTTNQAHDLKRLERDKGVVDRDFVQQPPLIPHKVAGYQVDLRYNKCLSCHSWANYKQAKATKISLTHFKDRDGNELSDVSPRRYFCNQCHVPQADAKPLVENTFQPVESLGR